MNTLFKICLLVLIICHTAFSFSGAASTGDIKIYFNNPVDTTVATSKNAIYLHNTIDDTLIAYINRAKYTIDVAVYNFIQSSSISDIAGAINNAYANGIRIRWIYDGSSSNSGISQLNSAIHTLASPVSVDYGIMHNKFMIVDANSPNDSDAIVWTGSTNWNSGQMNEDVNNVIILQDKDLALAYTNEFNEMWGDTGLVPDLNNSKFGPDKSDNTQHIFNVGGKTVECYFSPSDNTNDYILDALNSANSSIYFAVYTFTLSQDAYAILDKIQNEGVYVAGIIDQFSMSYTPYSILSPVMGNLLRVYFQSNTLYHNKLVIVDPCDYTSDPLVETGSHNWTFSANTENDENTLIIHDSTTANIYYQSFKKDFANVAGMLATCGTIGVEELSEKNPVIVFPNPSEGNFDIETFGINYKKVFLSDVTGKLIFEKKNYSGDKFNLNVSGLQNGVYVLSLEGEKKINRLKIIIQH